jgi:hypothetical protein
MTSFHLATIQLAEPVTIYLPTGRPRVVAPGGSPPTPITAANGKETILSELECAFWINVVTQTIHAQIARIPTPLLIYGPTDFAAVVSDLPEHHAERVLHVLGSDPAQALQALCDGTALPPLPQRVPREIANWRARAVLELAGLLPSVDAMISGMKGPEAVVVRNAWQSAAPLSRRGPTVQTLAPALGLDDAQIDAMFIQAESLTV